MIGPNQHNATDGVIVRGIRNLLKAKYPNNTIIYKLLRNTKNQFISDFHEHMAFDMIVVCGTPWLWDSFQLSVKYHNLKRCFHAHPNAKRLFMGIGSCLLLGDVDTDILSRPAEILGMQELFKDSTVIVRDSVAKQRLDVAQVESTLLPCPAYYCYGLNNLIQPAKTRNILVWTDPQHTISAVGWQDSVKLEEYYNKCLTYLKQYNAEVYSTDTDDIRTAQLIGLGTPKRLYNSKNTLDLMMTADKLLSGRVHCAVPARAKGAHVEIMKIDTRSLVVTDFEKVSDFTPYVADYLRLI